MGQVIELIKARDLRIQEILLTKSWDDLGLQEPKPAEEQKEESESKDEPAAEDKQAEEDKTAEEEEKKEEPSEEDKLKKAIGELGDLAKFDNETRKNLSMRKTKNGSYFYWFAQYRILVQLEQIFGIAEKSNLIKTLLQESMHPSKI